MKRICKASPDCDRPAKRRCIQPEIANLEARTIKLGCQLKNTFSRFEDKHGFRPPMHLKAAELVPILLASALVRPVRTFAVTVQALNGSTFSVKMNESDTALQDLKDAIEKVEGTCSERQRLFVVALQHESTTLKGVGETRPLVSEDKIDRACTVLLCVDTEGKK
jgi:hypothetical protein